MTLDSATLVVELFTEELPPKALKYLGEVFTGTIFNALHNANLHDGAVENRQSFASPRRLAVLIRNVRHAATPTTQKQKVLPVGVAFDAAGKPTPTLVKKLTALGLTDAASLSVV